MVRVYRIAARMSRRGQPACAHELHRRGAEDAEIAYINFVLRALRAFAVRRLCTITNAMIKTSKNRPLRPLRLCGEDDVGPGPLLPKARKAD